MLITVEGLDGAGKTTLVAGLAVALEQRGQPVVILREPGGVEVSERIRELLDGPGAGDRPARGGAAVRGRAGAARGRGAAAAAGGAATTVLLDRFVDSSLAYQGAGRGLGVEEIRALNAFGTGGLTPDRTLLLRIDPDGRPRPARRPRADRLELEDAAFFAASPRPTTRSPPPSRTGSR